MTHPEDPPTILIDAELDLTGASALRKSLIDRLGQAPVGPCFVELSKPSPTAPALQLAASLHKTLVAAAAFSGFGPNARSLLEM